MFANAAPTACQAPAGLLASVYKEASPVMHTSLLNWLIERNVVLQEEWEELPSQERESISGLSFR